MIGLHWGDKCYRLCCKVTDGETESRSETSGDGRRCEEPPGTGGHQRPRPRSGISWTNGIMRVNTRCSIDRSHADRERLMRPGDRPPSISIPQILICFQLKTLLLSVLVQNLFVTFLLSRIKYSFERTTRFCTDENVSSFEMF